MSDSKSKRRRSRSPSPPNKRSYYVGPKHRPREFLYPGPKLKALVFSPTAVVGQAAVNAVDDKPMEVDDDGYGSTHDSLFSGEDDDSEGPAVESMPTQVEIDDDSEDPAVTSMPTQVEIDDFRRELDAVHEPSVGISVLSDSDYGTLPPTSDNDEFESDGDKVEADISEDDDKDEAPKPAPTQRRRLTRARPPRFEDDSEDEDARPSRPSQIIDFVDVEASRPRQRRSTSRRARMASIDSEEEEDAPIEGSDSDYDPQSGETSDNHAPTTGTETSDIDMDAGEEEAATNRCGKDKGQDKGKKKQPPADQQDGGKKKRQRKTKPAAPATVPTSSFTSERHLQGSQMSEPGHVPYEAGRLLLHPSKDIKLQASGDVFFWTRKEGDEIKCAHSDETPIDTSSPFDDSCAALGFLAFAYSPMLGALIDVRSGMAVAPTRLEHKIPKKIRLAGGITRDQVLSHIFDTFSLDRHQDPPKLCDAVKSIKRIPCTIPGLSLPQEEGALCSFPGCGCVMNGKESLRSHWRKMHGGMSDRPSLRTVPFQKIRISAQGNRAPNLELIDGWREQLHASLNAFQSRVEWRDRGDTLARVVMADDGEVQKDILAKLGWDNYLAQFGEDMEFWGVVLIPPTDTSVKELQDAGNPRSAVEAGLLWLAGPSKILLNFLLNADLWVDQYSPQVRKVFKDATKVPIRKFQASSNKSYKATLTTLFCLIVRGHILSVLRAEEERSDPTENPSKPALEATESQDQLFGLLVDELEKTAEERSVDVASKLVEEIMVSLTKSTVPEKHGISCVMEQVCAAVYLTRSASTRRLCLLTSLIAKLRRAMACSFIYLCRAAASAEKDRAKEWGSGDGKVGQGGADQGEGGGDGYGVGQAGVNKGDGGGNAGGVGQGDLDRGEGGSNDEKEEQDGDADDEEEEQDGDGEGSMNEEDYVKGMGPQGMTDGTREDESTPSDSAAKLAQPSQSTAPTHPPTRRGLSRLDAYKGKKVKQGGSDTTPVEKPQLPSRKESSLFSLEQFIENNKQILNVKTSTTASGRLACVWATVDKPAREESSSTEVNWTGDRRMVSIRTAYLQTDIQISNFFATAKKLGEAPLEMLKRMFPEDCHAELDGLPSSLVQCASITSVFHHPSNKETFAKLISTLRTCLKVEALNSKGSAAHVKKTLAEFSAIQHALLHAIVYTMGVTARPGQISNFVYAGEDCNILLHKKRVLLAFPKAKQPDTLVYAVAWALPPCVGSAVLAYWGVVRQIEIRLLRWQGGQGPGDEVLEKKHGRYMFVHLCQSKALLEPQWTFNTATVNNSVKKSGLGLSCGVLRQLITSILQERHPDVCRDRSPEQNSDRQALDEQGQHTASVGKVHYGADALTKRAGLDQYQFARVTALSATYHALMGLSSEPPSPRGTLFGANINHVLHVAQRSALTTYGKASCSWDVSVISDYALKERPWLHQTTEPDQPYGDSVLVDVLVALLFGRGGRGEGLSPEVGYISDACILQASKIIEKALRRLLVENPYSHEDELELESTSENDEKLLSELQSNRIEWATSRAVLEEKVHNRLKLEKMPAIDQSSG